MGLSAILIIDTRHLGRNNRHLSCDNIFCTPPNLRSIMLTYHSALADRSRLILGPSDRSAVRPWELASIVGCGLFAAAAVIFLDFSLKIPGHAILRSVVPISFGLALVPRKGAGLLMSGSALLGLFMAGLGGYSAGTGATTSLLCIGPLLDLASRWADRGWKLGMAFGVAGLTANLLAFITRAATKVGGGARMRGSAGPSWWSMAPVTYALCGLVAGVICAFIWFRWQSASKGDSEGRTET